MAYEAIALKCPHCGAAISLNQENCDYCRQSVIITTLNNVMQMTEDAFAQYQNIPRQNLGDHPEDFEWNMAMGLCFLRLGLSEQASSSFEKAFHLDMNNADAYFYAAVSLMQGRRVHKMTRPDINQIEQYLDAAMMIAPKGIYTYLKAYVRYEYYKRKHIHVTPDYSTLLADAKHRGVPAYDIELIYQTLKAARPSCM